MKNHMNNCLRVATSTLLLIAGVAMADPSVCIKVPGGVTCSRGTVATLLGDGLVTVKGSQVTGATLINGMLTAQDSKFSTLEINGSASLVRCIVSGTVEIKGSLNASSSKFEGSLNVYSSLIKFVNTKISGDLRLRHTDSKNRTVYLDNHSEIAGNVIFDDGNGKVVAQGGSKIVGKVIGGQVVSK